MPLDRAAVLRYVFEHDRRLALWQNAEGETLAGFADWRGGRSRLEPGAERERLAELGAELPAELPEWALRALEAHGTPCRFDALAATWRARAEAAVDPALERTQRLASFPAAATVDAATLAAYVDGTLPPTAAARLVERAELDDELAAGLAELGALRGRLALPRPPGRAPGAVAVPAVAAAAPVPVAPRWLLPAVGGVVVIAAALALVLVVARRRSGADAALDAAGSAATPREMVVLADRGRRIAVREDGQLSGLDGLDAGVARAVARALLEGELPAAGLALAPLQTAASSWTTLAVPAAPPAADGPAVELVAPVATRLLAAPPTFRFRTRADVRSLRLRIADLSGPLLLESPELAGEREWRPSRALPRARVLVWQAEARLADGRRETVPAEFAEAPRFALVAGEELAFAEREVGAVGGSRLVAAVVAAELGARDETRAALAALAAENPGSQVVARLARAAGGG